MPVLLPGNIHLHTSSTLRPKGGGFNTTLWWNDMATWKVPITHPRAQDPVSVLLGIYLNGTTKGNTNFIDTVMLSTLHKGEKTGNN